MYAVINPDGKYTGTLYAELNTEISLHHAQYNESLRYVSGLENTGTEENPDWQPKPLSPQEAKMLLRQKRKAIEYGGFELEGQHWDSGEKDELRLASALQIFEKTKTQKLNGWKITEGVYITLTPEKAATALNGLLQHYSRAYALEEKKLAELEKLDSPEAIKNWLETELEKDW